MTAPNPNLAPALWAALRSAAAPASIADLLRTTPGRHHHLKSRLSAWAELGLVEPLPRVAVRFTIVKRYRGCEHAPTPGDLARDVWQALRRLDRPATLAELCAATGAGDRPLYCRIFRWIGSGHIVRVEPEPERFVLTDAGREAEEPPAFHRHKPRKMTTQRERIWRAMRVLKRFDVPLLMITAEVGRGVCENFIGSLKRAGYVRVTAHRMVRHKAGPSGFARSFSTYQLVRSTGPKPPVISCPASGGKFLFDRNTGERVDLRPRQPREVANGR